MIEFLNLCGMISLYGGIGLLAIAIHDKYGARIR